MKSKPKSSSLSEIRISRILVGTAAVLLIPLIAMQFTNEVSWDAADFITIGLLLLGAGLVYEMVSSQFKERKQKLIVAAVIGFVVLYIWAELAVGLLTNIGS